MSTFLTPMVPIVGEPRAALAQVLAKRYRRERLAIRTLAADIGRSYGWTRTVLLEAGVELQLRGGHRGPRGTRAAATVVETSEEYL